MLLSEMRLFPQTMLWARPPSGQRMGEKSEDFFLVIGVIVLNNGTVFYSVKLNPSINAPGRRIDPVERPP